MHTDRSSNSKSSPVHNKFEINSILDCNERKKFILDIILTSPDGFFELQERVILLLIIGHSLNFEEVTLININDCMDNVIKIHTPGDKFKIITLSEIDKTAIFELLKERIRNRIYLIPEDESLFIDYKGRRLQPELIKRIFDKHLTTKEDD